MALARMLNLLPATAVHRVYASSPAFAAQYAGAGAGAGPSMCRLSANPITAAKDDTLMIDAPPASTIGAQHTWVMRYALVRLSRSWSSNAASWASGMPLTSSDGVGLGADQSHKPTFHFDADHPELFASEDHGATPVEYVLVGLASCLTAGIAAVAQNREIQLRSVKATLTGAMDVQGILGIDPEVRNGFSDIKVKFDIDADATPEEIEALVAQSQKRSAVFDIVTNPTNVAVEVN